MLPERVQVPASFLVREVLFLIAALVTTMAVVRLEVKDWLSVMVFPEIFDIVAVAGMPAAVTVAPIVSPSVEARVIVLLPVVAVTATPVEPEAGFTIAPETSPAPVPRRVRVLFPKPVAVKLLVSSNKPDALLALIVPPPVVPNKLMVRFVVCPVPM